MFCYDETEYQPSDAERREAACKHGNFYACGLCMAEAAPKCKHGNDAFYCGLCLAETGEGRVTSERPLLPYGVPGNGVSQLVGAFSRGRRSR